MSHKVIAKDLGLTVWAVRKWSQIIKRGGPLEPPMGRPCTGSLGSFPAAVAEAIDAMRPTKEGWGSVTIHAELQVNDRYSHLPLPSVRSIDRYLKSQDRIKRYWRVDELATDPVMVPRFAHDVWQMDAEGNKLVKNVGYVGILNIKDTFSKMYAMTYPHRLGSPSSHFKKEHYQFSLRLAFVQVGMCHHLQVDHESVFYDNSSTSPFPVPIHLWAIGLGIPFVLTPKAKPFKQGAVEREHQTMHRQVCAGKIYDTQIELFEYCQQRRWRLNHDIPCRMLQKRPPLQVFPEAVRSDRPYEASEEEGYFDPQRIYHYLQDKTWNRAVSDNHTFSMGGCQYFLNNARKNSTLQIRFDPTTKLFHCSDADGKYVGNLKPKGISFKELVGNLEEFKTWLKLNQKSINIKP